MCVNPIGPFHLVKNMISPYNNITPDGLQLVSDLHLIVETKDVLNIFLLLQLNNRFTFIVLTNLFIAVNYMQLFSFSCLNLCKWVK